MDDFEPTSTPPGDGTTGGGEPARRRRRRRGPRRSGSGGDAAATGSQPGPIDGPESSGSASADAAWLEAAMAQVTGDAPPSSGAEGTGGKSRRRNRNRNRNRDRQETPGDESAPAGEPRPQAQGPAQPQRQRPPQDHQPDRQSDRQQAGRGRDGGGSGSGSGGGGSRGGKKDAGDATAWPYGGKRLTRPITMAPDLETAIEGPAFRKWAGPPRTIIAWVPDMFFGTKIRDTAHKMGYKVYFLREANLVAEKVRELTPDLVILDTATDEPSWTSILRAVREVDSGYYPVIAFGSHRDLDSRSRALDQGAVDFIANSRFFPEMHRVIEKYARVPSPEELEAAGNSLDEATANQGAFRDNPRFTRGPIVPGPAEDEPGKDTPEEPISFVELARRGARPQIPFNPNPSDD